MNGQHTQSASREVASLPTFSIAELSGMAAVTTTAVHSWLRAGLPHEVRGRRGGGTERRISIRDLLDWHVARTEERCRPRSEAEEALRLQKLKAETDLVTLERDKQIGYVVRISDVCEPLGRECRIIRNRLLAIPNKLAPYVAAATSAASCAELIEREVRMALEEISADEDWEKAAEYEQSAAAKSRRAG